MAWIQNFYFSIFDNKESVEDNGYAAFVKSESLINDFNISSVLRFQHYDSYENKIIPMISINKLNNKN